MDTLAKHTPGPWYYSPADGHADLIVSASGTDIARVEWARDMAVIAAAPEMLAALRELTIAAEGAGWDVDPCNAAILGAARAAIAKATGA